MMKYSLITLLLEKITSEIVTEKNSCDFKNTWAQLFFRDRRGAISTCAPRGGHKRRPKLDETTTQQ